MDRMGMFSRMRLVEGKVGYMNELIRTIQSKRSDLGGGDSVDSKSVCVFVCMRAHAVVYACVRVFAFCI
jgi:hypothetical protein